MISAWNLLWIVPICCFLSAFATGLCGINVLHEIYSEAYRAGLQDGRSEAKNNGNQT